MREIEPNGKNTETWRISPPIAMTLPDRPVRAAPTGGRIAGPFGGDGGRSPDMPAGFDVGRTGPAAVRPPGATATGPGAHTGVATRFQLDPRGTGEGQATDRVRMIPCTTSSENLV